MSIDRTKESYPPRYYDTEYCKAMILHHTRIAETYHTDAALDEANHHYEAAKWWRARLVELVDTTDLKSVPVLQDVSSSLAAGTIFREVRNDSVELMRKRSGR